MKQKEKKLILAIASALALSSSLTGNSIVQAAENHEKSKEASVVVESETKTFFLDEVVVTATRTPVKEFNANANINVITSADIEKKHYNDLSDALREVPGVIINNYSVAGYYGSNGLRINGSDNVVVLVDGVKLNSAGVNFSASMFKNLDNVERIEVLKGSASTLYGSDAKGGVINIITKKVDKNQSKIRLESGSYGTENYLFMNEGRANSWSWRISTQKDLLSDFKDGRGVTTPAALNGNTNSFKLTKEFNANSDLTFMYDTYKADYKFKSLWDNRLKKGTSDNYTAKLIYNTRLGDTLTNQLILSRNRYDDQYQQESGSYYMTQVETTKISDQLTKNFKDIHIVTGGFEFTEDKVISFANKKLTNRAFYIQDQWNMTKRWKLTSGIRHDDNSGFGTHDSPSVNLGYQFGKNTNMYAGYSEYFIPPSPTNLYSAKYGNPNIKPESGHTSEMGINHRVDDTMVVSAHVFKRYSKDRIGYVAPRYTNVGDEKANGWDIQLKKQFSDAWSGYVGYTHTNVDATAQRATNVDGYIPKGAWNIGADYSKGKWDVSLVGKGIIDRPGPLTADAVSNFFPATTYWVWDIGMNYHVKKDVKVFLKVNNIFDKFYAEQSNARYNWSTTPNEQWWSAPGRNIRIGVEYSF